MPPLADHPLRSRLANELHARPFSPMSIPCTATYVAIDLAKRNDDHAYAHLRALLDRHGAQHTPS